METDNATRPARRRGSVSYLGLAVAYPVCMALIVQPLFTGFEPLSMLVAMLAASASLIVPLCSVHPHRSDTLGIFGLPGDDRQAVLGNRAGRLAGLAVWSASAVFFLISLVSPLLMTEDIVIASDQLWYLTLIISFAIGWTYTTACLAASMYYSRKFPAKDPG